MRKITAAAGGIVILACAWLASAWYTGKLLEPEIKQLVEKSNASMASLVSSLGRILPQGSGFNLSMSPISYERGWFSTQARYAVILGAKGLDTPLLRLEVDDRYEHGPFPISALRQGRFAPVLALLHSELSKAGDGAAWFAAAQGQVPFSASATLSYGGHAQSSIRLAPARNREISFSGAELNSEYDRDAKDAKGVFQMPKLDLNLEGDGGLPIEVALADTQIDFDTRVNAQDLSYGDQELRIGRLSVQAKDRFAFSLEKLAAGEHSSSDGRFFKGEFHVRAGGLSFNGRDFGSPSATVTIDRLDNAALKHIMDGLAKRGAGQPVDTNELLVHYFTMLDAHPTLALNDLTWTNSKGASTLSIHSEWQAPAQPTDFSLAQRLRSARANLVVNTPMLNELTSNYLQAVLGMEAQQAGVQAKDLEFELLGPFFVHGLLVTDGNTQLKGEVQYKDGNLSANGAELKQETLQALGAQLMADHWPALLP
jgi:uncharacterized protein YdgA (DUF945 family)